VPGPLFEHAKATLGEQGVVDLIGVSRHDMLVSMVLNAAEIPLPGRRAGAVVRRGTAT
jgi:hypothetical protein